MSGGKWPGSGRSEKMVRAGGAGGAVVAGVATENAVFLLSIYLLLPVLNALLDYFSVALTRKLMDHLYPAADTDPAPPWQRAVLHIGIDVLAAVGFLVALAVVLPAGLQALNNALAAFGQEALAVDWGRLLEAARDRPFTDGIMVTFMLATTLLPTAVHLIAGATAILTPRWGGGSGGRSRGIH